jgi:hypothetical protein
MDISIGSLLNIHVIFLKILTEHLDLRITKCLIFFSEIFYPNKYSRPFTFIVIVKNDICQVRIAIVNKISNYFFFSSDDDDSHVSSTYMQAHTIT